MVLVAAGQKAVRRVVLRKRLREEECQRRGGCRWRWRGWAAVEVENFGAERVVLLP